MNNEPDNRFLVDLVRKRQKEEILALIREEESYEKERIRVLMVSLIVIRIIFSAHKVKSI